MIANAETAADRDAADAAWRTRQRKALRSQKAEDTVPESTSLHANLGSKREKERRKKNERKGKKEKKKE